jgi:UDP-N-acetylmuramoyl-L-alanyl-D-glutamate--2,6-diaminopimelate ligase
VSASLGAWLDLFPPQQIVGDVYSVKDYEIRNISHRSSSIESSVGKTGDVQVCFSAQPDQQQISKHAIAILVAEALPSVTCPQLVYGSKLKAVAESWSRELYTPSFENLKLVGVTGTNGKSTVVHMLRQLLELTRPDQLTASLGTLGAQWLGGTLPSPNTTPLPLDLYPLLAKLQQAGVSHVGMEASSHGLHQSRLAGLKFKSVAFTNLGRDHLDYHHDQAEYAKAKWKLTELTEGPLWIHAHSEAFITLAQGQGKRFGVQLKPSPLSQKESWDLGARNLSFEQDGIQAELFSHEQTLAQIKFSFWGVHNVDNALAAMALAMDFGVELKEMIPHLNHLTLPKGRLERVSTRAKGRVMVDYAHTPDALEALLASARQHVPQSHLRVLFGCGGDRDAQKRSEMSKVASRYADELILTSDNPRSESPETILDNMLTGVSENIVWSKNSNRRQAILTALAEQQENDTLLLCGKGHETEQIIGTETFHFDEFEICQNY